MPPAESKKKAARTAVLVGVSCLFVTALLAALYYVVAGDQFSLKFVRFREDASGRVAVFTLQNRSPTREISFRLDARVFFRTPRAEWVAHRNNDKELKYRGQVNPGETVEFPIRVSLPSGEPITEPFQLGLPYSTPNPIPSVIRGIVGGGGRKHEIHWTEMINP